jgi:hypothetical protein
MYLIFPSEEEALTAEATICENIRNWVSMAVPEAVTEDGAIRSRSANDGNFTDAVTTRWAIPRETASGLWAFLAPSQESINPVPLEVAMNGISAIPAPEPIWPEVELPEG